MIDVGYSTATLYAVDVKTLIYFYEIFCAVLVALRSIYEIKKTLKYFLILLGFCYQDSGI